MLKRYKKEIINLILEDWEGNREVGSPSPPFKKGGSKKSNINNSNITIVKYISNEICKKTKESLKKYSDSTSATSLTEYLISDWESRTKYTEKFNFIVDKNMGVIQAGSAFYEKEKSIFIGLLTVHPKEMLDKTKSNKGLGSKLLLNILKKAYKLKKDITVHPLYSAIGFYTKFGFSYPKKGESILPYKHLKEILKEHKK